MNKVILLGVSLLTLISSFSFAQTEVTRDEVITGTPVPCTFLGLSPTLRSFVPDSSIKYPITKPPKLGIHLKDDWVLNESVNPNALPKNGDPIIQKSYSSSVHRSTELANWEGIATTTNPGDPALDVGPNHVVQMMNGSSGARLQIWDKSGNQILGNTDFSTMVGLPNAGLGDPIVLYDERADRWLLSEFCWNCDDMFIAISQTSDPTGAYYTYSVTAPSFPDYPKFSIWDNSYVITTNENTSAIYIMDRSSMLAGTGTSVERFSMSNFGTIAFQAAAPVSLMGTTVSGTPALLMRMRDDAWTSSASDALEMWELDITWPAGGGTLTQTQVIPVSAFESELCGYTAFQCIPQAGSGTTLDPLREILMNRVMYRNFGSHEAIVCSHVVDVNTSLTSGLNDLAGIRWYELRRTGGGSWSIYQEGTYSPNDGLHRWMPTIGLSASGNIGLAYNVSSSGIHPEIRYTGRKECDPLGVMTETEIQLVDGTSPNNANRWGDYNSMGVDPSDGETFWFTATYNPSTQAKSRVGAFKIDPCVYNPPVCGINASTLTITEGSTVTFIDASTETPTSWNWNFDNTSVGSTTPATSTSQDPGAVTFNTPGTYEVELAASNSAGSCSTTVTITVNPNTTPPTCGINASATTIIEGTSVTFTDGSTDVPTSWNWTFDNTGVGSTTPANSTSQDPGSVIFDSPGTYEVELAASNAFGSCSTTVSITVDPSEGCDTLSNLLPSHTIVSYTSNGGYVAGWNGYGDISKAEYYDNYIPYTHVTAAEIAFRSAYDGGNGATVDLTVWDDNGGAPNNIIQSETFTLANIDASLAGGSGVLVLPFSSPVNVGGNPFYVGIQMNNFQADDSLGIYSNVFGESTVNTAWEQWSDNSWNDMETAWGAGTYSMWINPYVTDAPISGTASSNVTTVCTNTPITFTATGSNVTSYEWYLTGGTPATSTNQVDSATYSTAGDYTAYLVLNGSCTQSIVDSVEFTVTDAPIPTASTTDPGCTGNDGEIQISVSGGSPTFSYSIDNGISFQTNNTFTGLATGTYNIVVEDGNGCTGTTTATLNAGSGSITHTSSFTNPLCDGDVNGTITLLGSGGSGSYTYSIDGGSTFQGSGNFTGLDDGTYDIVVQEGGCQSTETITLTNPSSISVSSAPTDPLCASGTGSITITASGGTGTLQYSNDGGSSFQASNIFTGLTAGNYNIVVEDDNSCQASTSETLTDPLAISMSSTSTDPACSTGGGTITITASGGTGTLQYSIDGGSTFQPTNSFTSLTDGTYSIIVEDDNSCQVNGSESITVPNAITVTTGSTDATCGNSDGTITITASGGTGTLQYSIDGGTSFQPSNSFSALAANTYSIIVKDANNCQVSTTETVSNTSGPSISGVSTNDVTCNSGNDGDLTITATGTGTLQYSIDGGSTFQTGNSFTTLSANTYSIVVEDGNGCQTTSSGTVNEPAANTFNTSSTSPSCVGGNDGSITFSGATGSNPKRYSIDGGTTFVNNTNFTGVSAGTYDVAYRDGSGCIVYSTVIVSDPTPITVSSSSTAATCGGTDGTITITASGGTGALEYSVDGGSTFQPSASFSSLGAGAYSIVVQDANNCQQSSSETVSSTGGANITIVTPIDISCNGADDGSITIVATGSGTIQYSIDGGTSFQTSNSFPNLSAASYTIVVEDGSGCQAFSSATINEPNAITVSASSTDENCGNVDGTITITASGGTGTLQYSIDGGSSFQFGNTFSSLGNGSYSIVVKDDNNCQATSSVAVGINNGPSITSVNDQDVTCYGGNDGSITFTASGVGTLEYSIDGGTTWQTSNTFSGLTATTYNLYIKDGAGCTLNVGTLTLNQALQITYTVTVTDATCGNSDGQLSLNGSGGSGALQYSINGGTTFQATGIFPGLATGSYNIVIKDPSNCQTTGIEAVGSISGPSITNEIANDVSCNGSSDGSIDITASGVATLEYSIDGGSTYSTSNTFSGLGTGSYSISVKDGNNCITSGSTVSIGQPTAVSYSPTLSNESCSGNDGEITLVGSGGDGSYQYSIDGGTSFQSNGTFSNLIAGTYSIVVEDGNLCQETGSETLITTSGPSISSETANDISCFGASNGSISISATGSGTLQYSIDGGTTYSSSSSFSGLSGNSYGIVVQDGSGCSTTGSTLTINEPTELSYSATINDATCGNNNGSIILSGSGGTGTIQYSINGGITFQTNGTFNNLTGNTYNVVVLDANNCQVTDTEVIGNISGPTISNISSNDVSCSGSTDGSITITATGVATLQYSIDGGSSYQASNVFNSLSPATYNVSVQDGNTCITNAGTVTIGEPSAILVSASSNDASCGNNNGEISISVTGGIGTLLYSIDGGSSFQLDGNFYNLSTGTYNIVVKDDNNCLGTTTETVGTANGPTISNESYTDVTCNGDDDGSISISATGSGTLQYSIDGGLTFSTSGVFTNLASGSYNIVVRDGNSCLENGSTINIAEPSVITITPSTTNATCGVNDGEISISASGGTGAYQYSIDGGSTFQTGNTFSGIGTGSYSIVVEDANNCQGTSTTTVNSVPGPSIISSSSVDISCYGVEDGSVSIVASGAAPLFYSIDGGTTSQTSGTFTGLSSGIYVINVEDVNGCSSNSTNLTVTEPSAIAVSNSTTDATCGNSDGSISITATGGTGALQYSIDGGSTFQANGTFNNVMSGNYDIVVEDANSCESMSSVLVINADGPIITNLSSTDESCYGMNDGSIDVIATGIAPITYAFDGGAFQSSGSYSGSTGNISIDIQDGNGCILSTNADIIPATDITLSNSAIDATCGVANGSATVTVSGGTGVYSYEWDDPNTQTNNVAVNLNAGTYEALITDSNGCMDSTTVVINSGSTMVVDVEVTHESCPGEEDGIIATEVTGGQAPYTYEWSNGDSTAVIENLAVGDYTLILSDDDDCIVTLIIPIENEGGDCIHIPTAISPNGDGANETWVIGGIEDYPDVVVEIYNRWGSLLYSSNDYQNDWDGTFQGNNVSAGVYYYVITIDEDTTYTGSLTIIR